ncbi:PC-esterase domain-containing protein 1A-like [Protopterus annectens]|uniref:PC-esterase domain-containing protein 1A-like n=1 Tax=Protopterus annectens TaxID=7888 RepID=UPI001CF9CF08|nr:PC-esterase domain-containing protein 1A-like [Protopterus annectens]
MVRCFTQEEIRQLLHNKFVVILGDSIQRSVYKDLVVHLQRNNFATNAQLKSKGELSFEGDVLVEGGKYGELTNGTDYREVRQYRTDHHLVRFYFLTRVYSEYLESILNDFVNGPQPDVIIINSCVWDVSRYGSKPMKQYTQKLDKLFTRLGDTILSECLVIWNMAMPLGKKISGGFLVPESQVQKELAKFPFEQGTKPSPLARVSVNSDFDSRSVIVNLKVTFPVVAEADTLERFI